MNKLKIEYFVTEEVKESKDGCWDTTIQTIHERDLITGQCKKIGKYKRNYSSCGEETFAPFTLDGKEWYALYSYDYETLSLMKLPSCKKIKDIQQGFCPIEIWVPRFYEMKSTDINPRNGKERIWYCHFFDEKVKDGEDGRDAKVLKRLEWNKGDSNDFVFEREAYTDFAFMSGCVWGDDGSGKVEMIDLSSIIEGKPKDVKMNPLLGYFEMPDFMDLRDTIDIDDARDRMFKIKTQKTVWFDEKWKIE